MPITGLCDTFCVMRQVWRCSAAYTTKKKCKSAKILPQLVIILHYRSFIKHLYELCTAWCTDCRGEWADECSEGQREIKNITWSHREAEKDPVFLFMFKKQWIIELLYEEASDSESKTKRQFESQTEPRCSLPARIPAAPQQSAARCIKVH